MTGYQNNELLFSRAGRAIRRDLAITPDFASGGAPAGPIAGLIAAQGLDWLRDFAAAEAAGMALRVSLGDAWRSQLGIDIFVVGVRTAEAPDAAARGLRGPAGSASLDARSRFRAARHTDEQL